MNAGGTELLEAVYAAPDDDGRRLVYADWLQEHGDPRGELIVLQFERRTREPSAKAMARERRIVRGNAFRREAARCLAFPLTEDPL